MNALNDEEKRLLQQQESLQNMKMQQTAGKMEALAVAANMARQAGLTGTEKKSGCQKPANQCAAGRDYRTCRTRHFERPGKNQRQKSSGRKGYSDAARRKRVKDAGGNKALQGLSLDALLKAGEKDISDEELAKIAARENNALAKKNS